MGSTPPAAASVRAERRGLSPVLAVLVVLAAGILAVFAAAALAELDLGAISFERALPVVLMGEGLLYLLMLGGGAVAAPVLLVAWLLGFVLRAGLATATHLLSPAPGAADLFEGWEFYYVSYWPAAIAQVLLVAIALRLIRPAIATRRRGRRPQPGRRVVVPPPEPPVAIGHEDLLVALAESPDAPPESTTMLEERQIGDLAEVPGGETAATAAGPRLDANLPLLQEDGADTEPDAVSSAVVGPEAPVAEPEAMTPPPEQPLPAQVGDTDRLDPVTAEPAPVGSLQRMVDTVVSQVSADDIEIRVWGIGEGRTVLAGMPAGTDTAGVAPFAEALVQVQLLLCGALRAAPDSLLLVATEAGACGLRALDPSGELLLLLASRAEDAAELLPEGMAEVAAAMGDVVAAAESFPPAGTPAPEQQLTEDPPLTQALSQAVVLSTTLPHSWRGWRNAEGVWYALATTEDGDGAGLATALAAAVPEAERMAQALGLGEPRWLALMTALRTLTACPALLSAEAGVIAALTSAGHAPEQVARELMELVGEAGA